MQTTASLDHF